MDTKKLESRILDSVDLYLDDNKKEIDIDPKILKHYADLFVKMSILQIKPFLQKEVVSVIKKATNTIQEMEEIITSYQGGIAEFNPVWHELNNLKQEIGKL